MPRNVTLTTGARESLQVCFSCAGYVNSQKENIAAYLKAHLHSDLMDLVRYINERKQK